MIIFCSSPSALVMAIFGVRCLIISCVISELEFELNVLKTRGNSYETMKVAFLYNMISDNNSDK